MVGRGGIRRRARPRGTDNARYNQTRQIAAALATLGDAGPSESSETSRTWGVVIPIERDNGGILVTRRQQRFASWVTDVLVYIVVLNLFIEYVPRAIAESFTIPSLPQWC